jgi:hypothetical protein
MELEIKKKKQVRNVAAAVKSRLSEAKVTYDTARRTGLQRNYKMEAC